MRDSGHGGQDRPGGQRWHIRLGPWMPIARAFGGALFFSLPMLMTMEMWWLGFYMDPLRLALFLFLAVPMLTGLSYYAGFETTFHWTEDIIDALVALAVGFVAGGTILVLFSVIEWGMPFEEILGKVTLQAVPGAIGAMLAGKQLGTERKEESDRRKRQASYWGELFLIAVGALFFAFNVAPTEEMILIAYKMTPWHAVALGLVSILLMHVLVYTVGFGGQEDPGNQGFGQIFLHFTLVSYAIALLVSLYVLWTFGRTDGQAFSFAIMTAMVLGFPASLGAAAARLIL